MLRKGVLGFRVDGLDNLPWGLGPRVQEFRMARISGEVRV